MSETAFKQNSFVNGGSYASIMLSGAIAKLGIEKFDFLMTQINYDLDFEIQVFKLIAAEQDKKRIKLPT